MVKEYKNIIAKLIKETRYRLGETQSEIAAKAGISFRTYQRIEGAEIDTKLETIIKLNTFVDNRFILKLGYLLGEVDPAFFNIHQSRIRSSNLKILDTSYFFSHYEIQVIKKIFCAEKILTLDQVGYWEIHMESKSKFWCPICKRIYDFSDEIEFNIENLTKRIGEKAANEYIDSLKNLFVYNLPLDITHHVRTERVGHIIRREGRKLIDTNGSILVYGIAYIV